MKYIIIVAVLAVVGVVAFINKPSTDIGEINKIEVVKETNDTDTKTESEIEVSNNLNLSGQGLVKVPDYVFSRIDIQSLDLSNNKLEGSLQAEIRHLQNLKVLDLSNNKFTGIPAEVGQLKNLEVLNLSDNSITGLPYELGNLSNLKVLDLTGNAYSVSDLSKIKESLPSGVVIKI